MTSEERALAENALSNYIPPMFIFPRNGFHEHLIRDGHLGSVETAKGSGRMQTDDFHYFLEYVKTHAKPLKDHKKLLLSVNHLSHKAFKNILSKV